MPREKDEDFKDLTACHWQQEVCKPDVTQAWKVRFGKPDSAIEGRSYEARGKRQEARGKTRH
jgi:hypothetical protein